MPSDRAVLIVCLGIATYLATHDSNRAAVRAARSRSHRAPPARIGASAELGALEVGAGHAADTLPPAASRALDGPGAWRGPVDDAEAAESTARHRKHANTAYGALLNWLSGDDDRGGTNGASGDEWRVSAKGIEPDNDEARAVVASGGIPVLPPVSAPAVSRAAGAPSTAGMGSIGGLGTVAASGNSAPSTRSPEAAAAAKLASTAGAGLSGAPESERAPADAPATNAAIALGGLAHGSALAQASLPTAPLGALALSRPLGRSAAASDGATHGARTVGSTWSPVETPESGGDDAPNGVHTPEERQLQQELSELGAEVARLKKWKSQQARVLAAAPPGSEVDHSALLELAHVTERLMRRVEKLEKK